jgi:transcriptional regulator of arginine metabolism
MKNRLQRQKLIRTIVREGKTKTQFDLVDELAKMGCVCTQASISRDVADMELKKDTDGSYILKEDLHLKKMVTDLVQDSKVAQNLLVVKTSSGTAQGVAAALDAANFEELVGTIGGDDTILVITESDENALSLQMRIFGR